MTTTPYITCACGKRGLESRRAAKAVVRELRERGDDPNGHMLNAYRCRMSPVFFHVGHRGWLSRNLNDPTTWGRIGS